MSIISFGEIVWDHIDGKYYLGGAPFNFAAHIAKCGRQVSLVSAVGTDDLGRSAVEMAKKLAVGTSMIKVLDNIPTATVDVFLKAGQPEYEIRQNVSFDFIPVPDKKLTDDLNPNVFYFGTLAVRNDVSRKTLHYLLNYIKAEHVFCDINLRKNFFSKDVIEYSLRHCTTLKINDDEVSVISALLYGSILTAVKFTEKIAIDFKIQQVVITAGAKGCYVYRDSTLSHVPGKVVTVVDAVGAGDAFSAAFIHMYLNGVDAIESARVANEVGAFVASQRGAIPDYSETLKDLLKGAFGL